MRALVSAIFLGLLAQPASASSAAYELYLLACDGHSDCQRVANLTLASDGRQLDSSTPGVGVRVETLFLSREEASIRAELNLSPAILRASTQRSPKEGQVAFQIEATALHSGYFSPIAVFSSSGRIYQLWGRLVDGPESAGSLARK